MRKETGGYASPVAEKPEGNKLTAGEMKRCFELVEKYEVMLREIGETRQIYIGNIQKLEAEVDFEAPDDSPQIQAARAMRHEWLAYLDELDRMEKEAQDWLGELRRTTNS